MIDMHMHSSYSDGDKTVRELLAICEEKKLEYISLTDHNNLHQYSDPALKENIFHGKIIKGLEMDATFQNKKIEILAYNIKNKDVIHQWNHRFFSKEKIQQWQEGIRKKLLAACDKKNLVYDNALITKEIPQNEFISILIYEDLLKHPQNLPILGELANSLTVFIRKGLLNSNSDYCVLPFDTEQPLYTDVIDTIHKAGGLAFLAHPFEYRLTDTLSFIDMLREQNELDGIECFHPSATKEQSQILEDYANKHHLYISGGSDYHGHYKPDIFIGIGRGDLAISKSYVEKWANK